RRTRLHGIQPCSRESPRQRRQAVSRQPRHSCRPPQHGQLWQGKAFLHGIGRSLLSAEPSRPLHPDQVVFILTAPTLRALREGWASFLCELRVLRVSAVAHSFSVPGAYSDALGVSPSLLLFESLSPAIPAPPLTHLLIADISFSSLPLAPIAFSLYVGRLSRHHPFQSLSAVSVEDHNNEDA